MKKSLMLFVTLSLFPIASHAEQKVALPVTQIFVRGEDPDAAYREILAGKRERLNKQAGRLIESAQNSSGKVTPSTATAAINKIHAMGKFAEQATSYGLTPAPEHIDHEVTPGLTEKARELAKRLNKVGLSVRQKGIVSYFKIKNLRDAGKNVRKSSIGRKALIDLEASLKTHLRAARGAGKAVAAAGALALLVSPELLNSAMEYSGSGKFAPGGPSGATIHGAAAADVGQAL
jgi:hypothetical protein